MRGIYQNDFFIESATATALANDLRSFIRAYLWLAQYSYSQGIPSFPLLPKLHFLQEVSFTLARQARVAKFAINPAAHCCSMDEDFIGRTAAVSRCVSPKLMCRRTLERWLCHLQMAWSRVGENWWKVEVGETPGESGVLGLESQGFMGPIVSFWFVARGYSIYVQFTWFNILPYMYFYMWYSI